MPEGVVSNQLLVEDLAEAIANKLVVKMTTMQPQNRELPVDSNPEIAGSLPRTESLNYQTV
jgi:hypothetical protein